MCGTYFKGFTTLPRPFIELSNQTWCVRALVLLRIERSQPCVVLGALCTDFWGGPNARTRKSVNGTQAFENLSNNVVLCSEHEDVPRCQI